MSEDTTQEVVADPTPDTGQVEATEVQGVEDVVTAQSGTETTLQSHEDQLEKAAEESLWETLKKQKGFESEEDLARAYKEAEGELTRRSQSLKKSQEDIAAMEAVLDGLINGDYSPEEVAEEPTTDPNYDRLRKLEAKTDVRSVAEKHQDFVEVQPVMSAILAETENKEIFQGEKGVELLYKMAKAEKMEQELANAKLQGAKEVQLSEVEKVRAAVADGTKAKNSSYNKVFTAAEVAAMDDRTYMDNREEILRQQREGLIR